MLADTNVWRALFNTGHDMMLRTKEGGGVHKNPKTGRASAIDPSRVAILFAHTINNNNNYYDHCKGLRKAFIFLAWIRIIFPIRLQP